MKITRLLVCGIACAAVLLSNCTTTTGPTGPSSPPTQSATLSVFNNSSGVIGWVYLSTSQMSLISPGNDQLGSSTISAGSSYSITGLSAGYYYVAAVHLYTHDTAWRSLTVLAGHSYTWTLSDADFSGSSSVSGLTIINNSSYTIDYVYLSQSNAAWGNDWLGTSIFPGNQYTIPNVPIGYVNSKMVCSDATRYALHLLYIPSSGSSTITVDNTDFPSYAHGSLKIVNTSSTSIYYLYMRMSGDATWSGDQLGLSTVIGAGESLQLDLIDPGTYDFRVESSGHTYAAEIDSRVISAGELLTWTVSSMN